MVDYTTIPWGNPVDVELIDSPRSEHSPQLFSSIHKSQDDKLAEVVHSQPIEMGIRNYYNWISISREVMFHNICMVSIILSYPIYII
jgi:hypothetical protein